MTKVVLGAALAVALLVLAYETARLACENHERARELDRMQRACEELRAVRARLRVRVDAHRPGVPTPPIEGIDAMPEEMRDGELAEAAPPLRFEVQR